MKQVDPTLVALPDADLIIRIKAEQDSTALTTLVQRHSGAYFKVVNSYAASYPNVIKFGDMDDDKMYNLYTFIQAYDPTRGTKLSTYIVDRTNFLCKTLLRRDEKNPLSLGYSPSGMAPFNEDKGPNDENTFEATNGSHAILVDESPSSCIPEVVNRDVGMADIQETVAKVCKDKRFFKILQYRHLQPSKAPLSWRDIGIRLGLSHEMCRKIYMANIERVRNRLGIT